MSVNGPTDLAGAFDLDPVRARRNGVFWVFAAYDQVWVAIKVLVIHEGTGELWAWIKAVLHMCHGMDDGR